MLSDASHMNVWAQLQQGNQDALLTMYNKYYAGLMNYGIRLTGDRVLTNDCITQILLRLWDKRSELPAVENPRSYLLSCLRNELFAELRLNNTRAIRGVGFQRNADQQEPSYEEYLIGLQTNKSLKEQLSLAIESLSAREKELLQLRFFEDLSYEEITGRCQITKRTAYNIIHNALKTLKENLAGQYKDGYIAYPIVASFLLLFFLQ